MCGIVFAHGVVLGPEAPPGPHLVFLACVTQAWGGIEKTGHPLDTSIANATAPCRDFCDEVVLRAEEFHRTSKSGLALLPFA